MYRPYDSPLGEMAIEADERGLTGLFFRELRAPSSAMITEKDALSPTAALLEKVARFLDGYFAGEVPEIGEIPYALQGSEFQKRVWRRLLEIPYGKTVTYGQIAQELAMERGGAMSAQAVGGAVGRNPVVILVPCHRVLGAGGQLTGFGGGLWRKQFLLELEGAAFQKTLAGESPVKLDQR